MSSGGAARPKKATPSSNERSPSSRKKRSLKKTPPAGRPAHTIPEQHPPFGLYPSSDEQPSFQTGMASVIRLLQGRKNIAVLTGAGISVSCGIPDFRTKGSGLYSTLDTEELGLSCAEELFDASFFQEDPRPFYKFAKHLYYPNGKTDEKVRPSDSHKLLALLEKRKMLLRVYSQNIDGLEIEAGVSPKKVVHAHGSLLTASCGKCKRKVASASIMPDILQGRVARCQAPIVMAAASPTATSSGAPTTPSPRSSRKRGRTESSDNLHGKEQDTTNQPPVCGGVMKPGVTFFGEALNDNVRRCLEADRNKVDALIVIGTSLSVAPISKVIGYLPANIPRILINRTVAHPAVAAEEDDDENDEEETRDFRDSYVFDAYLLGFCDDVTRALAKHLFESGPVRPEDLKMEGQLLASLEQEKEEESEDAQKEQYHSYADWKATTERLPAERVFLFPGAQATAGGTDDDTSVLTYREVAQCDGCAKRIVGTIQKCVVCFDYDLCPDCFPRLSKTHSDGQHVFHPEEAADMSLIE